MSNDLHFSNVCQFCGDVAFDMTSAGATKKKYMCNNQECRNFGKTWEGESVIFDLLRQIGNDDFYWLTIDKH